MVTLPSKDPNLFEITSKLEVVDSACAPPNDYSAGNTNFNFANFEPYPMDDGEI
jgi:hypothetical protein